MPLCSPFVGYNTGCRFISRHAATLLVAMLVAWLPSQEMTPLCELFDAYSVGFICRSPSRDDPALAVILCLARLGDDPVFPLFAGYYAGSFVASSQEIHLKRCRRFIGCYVGCYVASRFDACFISRLIALLGRGRCSVVCPVGYSVAGLVALPREKALRLLYWSVCRLDY
jgi:hypothetical protein